MVTKERIKNSLDAKWRLSQVKIYSIVLGCILGFMLLVALFSGATHGNFALSFEVSGICAILFAVIFAPFPFYSWYRYREILRNAEEYQLCSTVLSWPSTSHLYRGAIYYNVELTLENGRTVHTETKPMWTSGAFAQFPLEDYHNKTVAVAYREADDFLVVLGEWKY